MVLAGPGCELGRRETAEARVRALGVAVPPPFFDDPTGLWQSSEHVLVQAFVAEALRTHVRDGDDQPCLRRMAERVRRSENDDRVARPSDPPLRHRRDRQRELALQAPRLTIAATTPHARRRRNPDQLRRRASAHPCLRQGGQLWTPIEGQFCEPIDMPIYPLRVRARPSMASYAACISREFTLQR